jgi:endo-1,4-beta-xylanase
MNGRYRRRDALALLGRAAVGALGLPVVARAEAEAQTLKSAAAAKGFLYGSDSDGAFADAPEVYRALFVDQCALFAPDLPWISMAPKPGENDFAYGSQDIGFALDHGMKLTGGHLLWHDYLPKWFGHLKPDDARAAATARIRGLAGHYAGKVFSWNVINEALDPDDGRADGLGRNTLLNQVGPDFFADAFRIAHDADSQALLVYNDYDLELDVPEHEDRRVALFGLLDRLQGAGAPIQAVGLQSHLGKYGVFADQFDDALFRKFLARIAGRGLKIILSELDVCDVNLPTDIAERDRIVADTYARYLSVALDESAVIAILTWGLSDRYTWLTPDSEPHFRRRDGKPERPLPFDADFKPKPAYRAILNAFDHAPVRT